MTTEGTMSSTSIIDRVSSVLSSMSGVTLRHDPPASHEAAGEFLPPEGLNLQPQIFEYLEASFGRGLYRHQFKALESIQAGHNTVVATRTSSGKSLIFTLPVLDALLAAEDSTALFLYPQKALANDQLGGIQRAVASIPALQARQEKHRRMVSRYDGATPQEDRSTIRAAVQVLLTNPDMLHRGILPWHEKNWSRFFQHLRYVIIDECHEYRGIFGTNVAYTLRRLRQVCALHGSRPQFIATSATISEPQIHL
jgi:DEAD/DEAH box helicase domain-containing protein